MGVEEFLNPEVLRPKLIAASMYIAAFELLKNAIVERLRNFYTLGGFREPGVKYKSEVLSKNKSPVYASLQWLKESHAIDENDLSAFERVKTCRNDFAHELTKLLMNELPHEIPARFSEMITLLGKIEKWWILNVDIATDPDFENQRIDEKDIIPGPIIALQLMVDIALGQEGESKKYFDAFRKPTTASEPSIN
jgi:hypothetical protein